jgi:hypothetical protein
MVRMSKTLWRVGLVLLLGGVFAATYRIEHDEESEDREEEEVVQRPRDAKDGSVELSASRIKNAGIETAPARKAGWTERMTVYGRVVPNPRGVVDLRAPFAGAVQTGERIAWPQLGQLVRPGETLGVLDIRVGPQERLELDAKLREARLRNQGAVEVEQVQRERVDRLRSLATSDIVSRRELTEALVALSEAQTQLSTTNAALELWTTALSQINDRDPSVSRWRMPLVSAAEGEITQVLVRPGAAVEAGSPVVRIVNFKHLLVRLDFPPNLWNGPPPPSVRLLGEARGENPTAASENEYSKQAGLEARLVGMAPQVDVSSQATGYWYEASAEPKASPAWRPGLFVKARISPPDATSQPAIAVPATAVLWHAGQAWLYVQTSPGQFARRSVQLLGPDGADCLVASGVVVGELVVSAQSQVLLSEEFRTEGDDD